jgi:diaminopimelate epimerase
MASETRPFLKMNGLGNDFVVWDAREKPLRLTKDQIAKLGDREHGIGFDQMITVERSTCGVDAFMRIHNSDGGQVDACGNATRCIGRLLMEESTKELVTIETNAGLLHAFDAAGLRNVTVDMGKPRLNWDQIPLAEEFADTRAIELQIGPIDEPILHTPAVVNVGNPHAIFWVKDVEAYDLARVVHCWKTSSDLSGRRQHLARPYFDDDQIVMKVWERGAGLTLGLRHSRLCGRGCSRTR